MNDVEIYDYDRNLSTYSKMLFDKYFKGGFLLLKRLKENYCQPRRYFHNLDHIDNILSKIHKAYFQFKTLSNADVEILVFTTWFHDIVYDPKSKTNEEDSVKFFFDSIKGNFAEGVDKEWDDYTSEISEIILDTKEHKPTVDDRLSKIFCDLDMSGLYENDMSTEYKIFKEFQFVSLGDYKKGRIEFLAKEIQNIIATEGINDSRLDILYERINWVRDFKPKIGIYPGSFNPFHTGHLNILQKAEQVFDKVIILLATNPQKDNNKFCIAGFENAGDYLTKTLPYHQIAKLPQHHFLTDYFKFIESYKDEKDANYFLIRGLRNGDDLAYEDNQLQFLKDLKPDIKEVFFTCDNNFKHISSSAIRSIAKINPKKALDYLVNE